MRDRVKYLYGIAVVGSLAMSAVPAFSQANPNPNSAPNPYRLEDGWAKQPVGRNHGSTIGLNVDRDGKSMWIFDRCGGGSCEGSNIAPLTKFDENGNAVKALGAKMFNFPHGLWVDQDNNVWVTDGRGSKDKKGNTAIKLDQNGKVLMTLGEPGTAGNGPNQFNAPSDVITAPNGDIFVADGHGGDTNARIVKFDKTGKFIKAWGQKGTATGEFQAPHGLAMDSAGRLFVADRENNRIQIFDQDGKFIAEWKQFGRPSGVWIDKNDTLYVADSQSSDKLNPGFKQGIRIGSAKDGKVTSFIEESQDLGSLEGVGVDDSGNIYAGYTGAMNLKRFANPRTN